MFHESNRGYTQEDLAQSWEAYFRGYNPFKIREADAYRKQMSGWKKYSKLDANFEDAKRKFDSETQESLTREHIKTKDVVKMVKPVRVIVACFLISGFGKIVKRLVR